MHRPFRGRHPKASTLIAGILAAFLFALSGCERETPPPQESRSLEQSVRIPTRFPYESPESATPPPASSTSKPNILLITLDTTRPHRLSCYGYKQETTPQIDALAEEALLFENCMASAPITLPSHCTIITGREPFEHGVRNNGTYVLDDEIPTLAEILRQAGYATGAVMGSFVLSAGFGTGQGFDDFDDDFAAGAGGQPIPERIAETITQRGLAWIRTHRTEPWFAWLHYFDPHDPYRPPYPFGTLFRDPYNGELAYMDAHLGGLFRELKRMGQWEQTMVVLVGDHGEGLGDHNEETHSLFLYGSTVDVPLILKFPQATPWVGAAIAPRRVTSLVATTDLFPTILAVAAPATSVPPGVSGQNLLPLLRTGMPVREQIYTETLVPQLDYGWAPYRGLRTARWKLILAPNSELFDLALDPGETQNLYFAEPDVAAELTATLLEIAAEDRESPTATLGPATIENLRSLGYIAGGSSRTGGSMRDAKDMGWALEAFNRVRVHMQRKEVPQTIEILEGVLARDETNRYAQRVLIHHLLLAGDGARAADLCQRILIEQPDAADRDLLALWAAEAMLRQGDPRGCLAACAPISDRNPRLQGLHLLRARALGTLGNLAGAREASQEEDHHHPGTSQATALMAKLYLDHNEIDAADALLARAMQQYPSDAPLHAELGRLRIAQKRPQEALRILQQVLSADPQHADANFRLGLLLNSTNQPNEALNHFVRAVMTEPGNAEYQASLGSLLVMGRNYPKAIEHLETAIRLGRRDQQTYYALGAALASSGRTADARSAFTTALDLDPQGSLAEEIRVRIVQLGE